MDSDSVDKGTDQAPCQVTHHLHQGTTRTVQNAGLKNTATARAKFKEQRIAFLHCMSFVSTHGGQ